MIKNNTVAVVVTYNRRNLVIKCIDAILSQEGASCDIIIIDNGSKDGTQQAIKSTYEDLVDSRLRYYNTEKNLGGAGGFNRGIKIAVCEGYEYIWVMDDDVIPDKDALVKLFEADQRLQGKWGILSSYAYWMDGSPCKANIQKKGLFTFLRESDYKKELVRVKMASFVSMFVKSSVVRIVGLPIADYFIYTDDYEFSSRISRLYPVYVVPVSKVLHEMMSNQKVNIVRDSSDRLYRYNYLYRNDVHCYKQSGVGGWAYLLLKFIYTLIRLVMFEKDYKSYKVKVLINGYKEGLRFMPVIEYP